MIRFGLCSLFKEEPIRFRQTTVTFLKRKFPTQKERLPFLTELVTHNIESLKKAIHYCASNDIGAFRVVSQLLPCYTHPEVGYSLLDIPHAAAGLKQCGALAKEKNIRLSFHPDQFVVLNSPTARVRANALKELSYHTEMAQLLEADVIILHGGGVYGDKPKALLALENAIHKLPTEIKKRLVLENDDTCYTPQDLFPLCIKEKIPLCYDVHHHRCNKDAWSEEEATQKALSTWDREPLFHLSSPIHGWNGPTPSRHHDYIDPNDFPKIWLKIDPLTVDIEAKAKELAVRRVIGHFS